MQIRKEERRDWDAVYEVVKTAFQGAAHSDGQEHNLVVALRDSAAFIPELSLVAEDEGKIVGHIMFTKIGIGTHTGLALAPLAVLPEYQGQGVGATLVREGHRVARALGYQYSVVLGSETYYPRFGYRPAAQLGIRAPFPVPDENFMALPLSDTAAQCSGTVVYDGAFGI
ncbi:GNAT family N-acetyltransferase [Intestinibacillus massiliensis]|uniref:GNAT family N-acetyltransferase n=1 Tax=Intestinibacillus massiliensis TaxID=1871029 RepID=UPI000B34FCBF|nr:N-acetyltransferase [Intestinibacillus massiliensis]